MSAERITQFKVKNIDGTESDLSAYENKVMLIVNVASKCGFTPQYEGLEKLYRTYKDKGLVVLGFPCNQFGGQEPGAEQEIKSFCSLTYDVTFPLFAKVDVNGEKTAPLFKHLKEQATGILGTKAIKWNFTKFLVGKDGRVVDRLASTDKPESLTERIEALLAE